jgi:hypothetical protein
MAGHDLQDEPYTELGFKACKNLHCESSIGWEELLMKWAEVIMVRAVGGNGRLFDSVLQALMDEVAIQTEHDTIRVLRREKLESDICIVLFHGQKKIKSGGSTLGLHLAAALEEVGQVNHTIWNNIEG